MFSKLHLTDSLEGLVLANCGTTIALAVLLFTQFLQGVPREVTEAAKLDGATRLRTLLSVLVPLSWPAVVSVTIFISVFAWNDFFAALVLIQSTSHFTIQLAINNFSTAYAHLPVVPVLSFGDGRRTTTDLLRRLPEKLQCVSRLEAWPVVVTDDRAYS